MLRVQKHKNRHWRRIFGASAIALSYVLIVSFWPAPKPTMQLTIQSGSIDTGTATEVPWPATGNGAIGAADMGVLVGHDADRPSPTASIAKVVLALAILRKHPLTADQSGPTITLTNEDTAYYHRELARGGSTFRVEAGEQLTQRQAFEALLIVSGNNIADSLARWAFGSEAEYTHEVEAMLRDMGLTKTHIADASGYSPQTVSTPRELVQIGQEALKQPAIAAIVAQTRTTLPLVGTVANTNTALATNGINGIKTGHTGQSGGCLLFSATRNIGGQDVTLVGAIQALPVIADALDSAPDLVEAGFRNIISIADVSPQKAVGSIHVPWSPPVALRPAKELRTIAWKGSRLMRTVTIGDAAARQVGQIRLGNQVTAIVPGSPIPQPSLAWRLTHPLQLLGWVR